MVHSTTFRQILFQNVHHYLSLFAQILLIGLSWGLISTVTISPRLDLGFLSYSLEQFIEVSLQRYLWRQNWDIYAEKKSKSMMWFNTQRIREYNFGSSFVTLNDLENVTSKAVCL